MNNTQDTVTPPATLYTDVLDIESVSVLDEDSSKSEKNTEHEKSKKAKKINTSDIYRFIDTYPIIDQSVIEKIITIIEAEEDPAPLFATLLRHFMDGVKRSVWISLREHDAPARLFECLCISVGMPGLGETWRIMGRDSAPDLLAILNNYVPPTKEAASIFLKDRSLLPLSILIYRAFRNDDESMGLILRDWVSAIAKGCEDQKLNSIGEAQRTAHWLFELASLKLTPSRLLAEIAPSLIGLRLGVRAFSEVANLAESLAECQAQLKAATETEIMLRQQLGLIDADLITTKKSLVESVENIAKLERKIEFITRHTEEERIQAVQAACEKLARAIKPRAENIKLLIDRQEPNIEAGLILLSEIENSLL